MAVIENPVGSVPHHVNPDPVERVGDVVVFLESLYSRVEPLDFHFYKEPVPMGDQRV
mgnify:CR=1 FL=1